MRGTALGLFAVAVSSAHAEDAKYPRLDATLDSGRKVWMDNCEGCHGYGFAGSPNPQHPDDWRARLEKDVNTLHRHAIQGFFGPTDSWMPPRGGNEKLTDAEVIAAVDYMRALAQHHIDSEDKK